MGSAAAGLLLGDLPGLVGDFADSLSAAFLLLGLGDCDSALDFLGHQLEGFVDVLAVLG